MNKHTPGPWVMEVGDETADYAHQFPVILAKDYEVVGTEGFYSGNLATDIANATLAAAAPELLEALEMLLDFPEARPQARAAIAKAKGEKA